MHLVAGETRHRGLTSKFPFPKLPRALCVHRRDQVPDSALELHRMTAQAIVDQKRALVMIRVQKNLRITRPMRPRGPVRIFLAMALGAALFDFQHICGLQSDLLRRVTAQMLGQLSQVLEMKTGIQRQHVSMAFRAGNIPVRRLMPISIRLPDFVALGAGAPLRIAVVHASAWQKQDSEQYRSQRYENARPQELSLRSARRFLSRRHVSPSKSSPGCRTRDTRSP